MTRFVREVRGPSGMSLVSAVRGSIDLPATLCATYSTAVVALAIISHCFSVERKA